MNRRQFTLATSALMLLSGCDTAQKPAAMATLTNSEEIQACMKRLADAISELEASTSDFDDSNWKDVVPEVRNSAEMVQMAFGYLQKALGIAK